MDFLRTDGNQKHMNFVAPYHHHHHQQQQQQQQQPSP